MKRTIILYGTCLSGMYSIFLNHIPFFRDHFDIVHDRNFDHPAWPARRELRRAQIENCAYLFEHIGRTDLEFPRRELLPADCVIVRFPYQKLKCLWPFWDQNDPRNKPESPQYPAGQFPCGDRFVIEMMTKGVPRGKILEEYLCLDIKHHADLDGLYEKDMERMREVDEKCDIRVHDMVKKEFRTTRLFNGMNRPADYFAELMFGEILKKSGLVSDAEPQLLADVEGVLRRRKQMYFLSAPLTYDSLQIPIHPRICEHFDLRWADGNTRYEYLDLGQLTFQEYMRRYIDYEGPRPGQPVFFGEGFYYAESDPRWMANRGLLHVAREMLAEPSIVTFELTCSRGEHYARFPFGVRIYTNGTMSEEFDFETGDQTKKVELRMDRSDSDLIIRIESDEVFVPSRLGINHDSRFLSLSLRNLAVCTEGKYLTFANTN